MGQTKNYQNLLFALPALVVIIYSVFNELVRRYLGLEITLVFITILISFILYKNNLKINQSCRGQKTPELEASNTLFRDLIEELPMGAVVLDKTGRISYVNGSFQQITGYDSSLTGQSYRTIAEKLMPCLDQIEHIFEKISKDDLPPNGLPYHHKTLSLVNKHGHFIPVNLSLLPIKNSQGCLTGVLCLITDSTNQVGMWNIQQKIAFLLDYTSSTVMAVDKNLRINLFNRAAEELFSIKKDVVMGRHVTEIFNDYEIENHPIIKTIVNGQELHNQDVTLFVNGQLRTLLFDTGLLKDDNGTITGAIAICNDISEKKRIEEELKNTVVAYSKEKSYMRNVLNNLPEAIIAYDKNLQLMYMNSMAETLEGLKSAKPFYAADEDETKFDFQQSVDFIRLLAEEVLKSRNPFSGEQKTIITKADGAIPVSIDVHPIYNEIKQINGVMVIARDISDKMAHEKLMYLSSSILDSLNSSVVSIDAGYNIIVFNPAAERLFGLRADEVIGKNINDIWLPFSREERFLHITLESCWGIQFLETSIQVGGEEIIILVNTNVIRDREDNIIGAVGVFQDITELRRTQNAVREKERLAIIGQMAAGMAHEIKNPLTAVRGFAQLLQEKCPDNVTLVNYVKIILEEIDQASSVITNFLQLARPKQPVLEWQSANNIVEEILAIVGPQAFLKKIKVECEQQPDLPLCRLDRDQIKQVLLNMCQNAIEAIPESGGFLKIKTGILPTSNEIYIEISDTGCGIPQDKIEKIGVPFFTTKADGTGLGLSISNSIIYAHNGRVEIESTEGKGATFKIFLPF